MTNDFKVDLAYSVGKREFWNAAYKKAFPVMLEIVDYSANMKAQAAGVDVMIKLPFGGKVMIDEKLRRKKRADILIEYISNDQKNTAGWIEKDLKVDFIAYAFEDTREVYFIPFKDLKRVWLENKDKWLERYKIPPAKNEYYNTLNVAVPLSELEEIRIIKVAV